MTEYERVKADRRLLDALEKLVVAGALNPEELRRYERALDALDRAGGLGVIIGSRSMNRGHNRNVKVRRNTLSVAHRERLTEILSQHAKTL